MNETRITNNINRAEQARIKREEMRLEAEEELEDIRGYNLDEYLFIDDEPQEEQPTEEPFNNTVDEPVSNIINIDGPHHETIIKLKSSVKKQRLKIKSKLNPCLELNN